MNLFQARPLIGMVTGTSRQGRLGDVPAHWLYRIAEARRDLQIELIDLGDLPVPFMEASVRVATSAKRRHGADRWAGAFERLDGLIVVLPEVAPPCASASVLTPVLAQAVSQKPVAFVTFGAEAAAPPNQRLGDFASRLGMAPMAHSVRLTSHEVKSIRDMQNAFEDFPHLDRMAGEMLDELCGWASAFNTIRRAKARMLASPVARAGMFDAAFDDVIRQLREWMDEVGDTALHWIPRAVGRASPWAG